MENIENFVRCRKNCWKILMENCKKFNARKIFNDEIKVENSGKFFSLLLTFFKFPKFFSF
jgi:hypothetical protein